MRNAFPIWGLFLVVSCAWADTITVGDTTYTDVYVTKSATMYYVSNPADGSVLNVALGDATAVEITQDRTARNALFQAWQAKNRERRGLPEPAPVQASEADAAPVAAPIVPAGGGLKSISRGESEYDVPSSPSVSSSTTTRNPLYQQQRMFEMQRNAQIAQLRQQREAAKYQRLRNVRVITSQDVGGAGGRMGGGYGGGMGGYGGGMGGYGGGMGGMGGRRR